MKAMVVGETVVLVMEKDEVENIGMRVGCSSFQTFDAYRKDHSLSGLPRHPLAENLQAALDEAGVGDEDC